MNEINYLKHILYTPDTIHRRYDLDIPKEEDTSFAWVNQAKRIAIVALPFISLYRPAGTILSLGMGGARAFSHIHNALSFEEAKNWKAASFEMFQTALVVFTIASSIFHFTIGTALSTSVDIFQGMVNLSSLLSNEALSTKEKMIKVSEEMLQILTSAAYLSFMISGSLEMMLAFALLQATVSFFQASEDIRQERYLEAAAKFGMGCIRFTQAKKQAQQIQKRNQFLTMMHQASFLRRALIGKKVFHLLKNPLSNVPGHVDENSTKLGDVDFGAHFHGMGKDLVKGDNLIFHTKVIHGKKVTELEFKVNHVFREQIQEMIQEFSTLDRTEMKEMLEMTGSHAKGVLVEKNQTFFVEDKEIGNATKITLDGLGSIFVGNDSAIPSMYNRVIVQMDAEKNLYEFHELMAFLDIDRALHVSRAEDIDRLKMGHLFRIFFPKEATPLERSKEFFDLPLDDLKAKMIEKAPEMERIFNEYYENMTPEEILEGRVRYRVNGLADRAYEEGARGLTAAITGTYSDKEVYERVASMLKMGMLSSEFRTQGNMNTSGLSTGPDFYSGGSDSVFTQMITEKDCLEHTKFNEFYYNGPVRMMISLEALETGSYQYYHDSFGNRTLDSSSDRHSLWGDSYASRPNILEFTNTLQNTHPTKNSYHSLPFNDHEVMIKERIDPSLFTGIVVANEGTRDGLLNHLRSQHLVQLDSSGHETILGISTDRFIHVTKTISEDLFTA
ncbi:MAG: hypothetical protein Q8L98_02425 [Chlamydiales bacterium]|nr:hypothetical protein [Chlamydiales bacterium]